MINDLLSILSIIHLSSRFVPHIFSGSLGIAVAGTQIWSSSRQIPKTLSSQPHGGVFGCFGCNGGDK
jgi:hypothetical protein